MEGKKMSTLYRVVSLRETYGLPGERLSATGWWSRDPSHTINLIHDIVQTIYDYERGLPWEFELLVLMAQEQEVTVRAEGPRTGPRDPRYDGSEVFVMQVRGHVLVRGWREFAQLYGENPDSWV